MQDLGGKNSTMLAGGDNDWFKTITVGNEIEIQSSQLALTHSTNQSVKDFAQHMIDDHRMAEGKVGDLAAQKGVALPTKLDADHQMMLDDLTTKSGPDFDKAYIADQVQAHKDAVAADKNEADNGIDPQVKGLASSLLDTLQMHLSMAEKLQNGI
jgi:putative membrane protein